MNIIDAVIIILFIVGVLGGIKRGAIRTTVSLVGTIGIFILSYYLKNPLANFFYEYLPFFSFGGYLKGIIVINILVYELIAFVSCFSILSIILNIILKLSGIIEKILNMTIILGAFSKIIGAVLGFLVAYVYIFIILFVLNQPFFNIKDLGNSKISSYMLNNTLVLSNVTSKATSTINEIVKLKDDYKNLSTEEYNYMALEIMLKNKIVNTNNVKTLINKDKLPIKNIDNLIEKYGGEK
ncbi:MAG: CvpA family protein [Bacilli bacterium]